MIILKQDKERFFVLIDIFDNKRVDNLADSFKMIFKKSENERVYCFKSDNKFLMLLDPNSFKIDNLKEFNFRRNS